MRLDRRLALACAILGVLLVSLGTWWFIFLSREGENYARYHLQRFQTDRAHALMLIHTVPEIATDPAAALGESFPDLLFEQRDGGYTVRVNPAAAARVRVEAARRKRMFLSEGIFFLGLLGGVCFLIVLAYRRERDFRRARELFLASATHELRTPVAGLRLCAETLERPDLREEDRRKLLESLKATLLRLEDRVDRVLAASRESYLEHGQEPEETMDLAEEAGAVLSDMEGFLTRYGARLETDLAAGCRFQGRRSAFQTAVRNMVQNAVVHSPPPARVRVEAAREDDRGFRISVCDEGPGIPRRYRKKIFQCFFRPPAREGEPVEGRGTGLGLYLVKRSVELLGGRITVESGKEGGSVFTLHLPANREKGS